MKKVLITGGNGDISKAIIKKLEQEGGYEIYAPSHGEMDVTDIDAVSAYVEKIKPDMLINNAGYVKPQSIKQCDIEIAKCAIDVNLFGTYNCTAAVLRIKPDAQIINIGSSAATKIHATWSSYCASKAAVVMATQCWAADGVDTVCVSPGRTRTKMRKGLYPDEDQTTLMDPDDFAAVVMKAVHHDYPAGSHINVNINNVKELING
jgi:3-oxoacyl-[acyl-carrier protein] reductase